jgi:hypothetical protein
MPVALHWFVSKPIKIVNFLVINGKWKKQKALNRLYGAYILPLNYNAQLQIL